MWLTSQCSTVAESFKENSTSMCLSKKCRRLDANLTINVARVNINIFFSYVMNCQTLATLLSHYLLGGRINWLIKFFPKKPSKVETSAMFISHHLAPIQQQGKLQTHSLLLPKEVTVNGILGLLEWELTRRKTAVKLTDTLCFQFGHNSIRMHSHMLAPNGQSGTHMIYGRQRGSVTPKKSLDIAFNKHRI